MPWKVLKEIALNDGTKVVVVDVLGDKSIPLHEANHNIYKVDEQGRLLWQVRADPGIYERSPFTGLRLEGGKLIAYRWDGVEYVLDPATGQATPQDFVR